MTSLTPAMARNCVSHFMRLALLLVLLTVFALRLYSLSSQNIWWDEARNIDVALRPLTQIATAPELDIQPPFYFWLLHLWGGAAGIHMNDDPIRIAFITRFLSVAVGLAATALLYPLGRRAFAPAAGLFTCILAALSPFWLAESQETRMYTVGIALLVGAALALDRGMGDWRLGSGRHQSRAPVSNTQSPLPNPQYLALFVILSTMALLTHYNVLFVLLVWYAWWGVWALFQRDRWRWLRTMVLCGLATVLLVVPIIPIALRQIPTYANPNLTVPTLGQYLAQNWQAFLAGYAFDPAMLGGNGLTWLWIVLALAIIGVLRSYHAIRNTQHATRNTSLTPHPSPLAPFLLVWGIGALGLYYSAVLDRGAFNVRYNSFVTPAVYGVLGGALAGWGKWWRPAAIIGLAIVAVGMIPALQADLYDPRLAREDIAGVTGWLRQVADAEDVILVDQKYPFGFYYQRYTIDPTATPSGPEAAPARYLFVDINTVDQRLNEWARNARQVFWVQWFESDTDPRHAVPFLLDKAGQRAGSQGFQGYAIDWWVLNPPNQFVLAPGLTPMRFVFPPAVETVAVSLPTTAMAPGRGVPVAIRWQRVPNGQIERPLKARVALYDQNDARLAQSDERLLNDRHLMPSEWSPPDQPLNVYMLSTPADLAEGMYELRLLVYDAETLEPLTLVDEAGNPTGQEATLGMVEIRR